jgi:hypothetical protein
MDVSRLSPNFVILRAVKKQLVMLLSKVTVTLLLGHAAKTCQTGPLFDT